jgi:hypothetical protein
MIKKQYVPNQRSLLWGRANCFLRIQWHHRERKRVADF